ncbi:hypothetical protein VTJ49DRAFT_5303 [Mycothermus thermophilus]|uniref:F-box domain-containing protein n=1 Tax=Humicola insolens TaxID=85995 RepID=A0ABR3V3J8_HUMIN
MSLLKLPDELLAQIARYFVHTLRDYSTVLDATISGDDYSTAFDDENAAAGRRSLLAVSRANRRLNAIATPFLYHTVHITNLASLYLLLRTFLESESAEWVQEAAMSAGLSLTKQAYKESETEATRLLLDTLRSNANASRTYRRVSQSYPVVQKIIDATVGFENGDLSGFPAAACTVLLLMTTNVTTLYLVIAPYNRAGSLHTSSSTSPF